MADTINKYVTSCDLCQKNKHRNEKKHGLLQPLPIPESKWSWITTDAVTHLPTTPRGFNVIQGYTDALTKQVHLVARKDTDTSTDMEHHLWNEIIRHHGCPDTIISDRDPLFTSQSWIKFCKHIGIDHRFSTAFHAQTDGQSEHTNRTFSQIMRMFVHYNQDNWDLLLPMIEFAMNNATSATTRHSPFFLNYGRHPRMPGTISTNHHIQQDFNSMDKTIKGINRLIKHAKEQQASYYNRHVQDQSFSVGDLVLLDSTHLKLPIERQQKSRKLMQIHIGPFKIIECIGSSAYRLQLPGHLSRVHPVFNVSLLHRYKDPRTHFPNRQHDPRPAPDLIDSNFEYEVEDILDKRKFRKGHQYLVKWVGYPKEDSTWEPLSNLKNANDILKRFNSRQEQSTKSNSTRHTSSLMDGVVL